MAAVRLDHNRTKGFDHLFLLDPSVRMNAERDHGAGKVAIDP